MLLYLKPNNKLNDASLKVQKFVDIQYCEILIKIVQVRLNFSNMLFLNLIRVICKKNKLKPLFIIQLAKARGFARIDHYFCIFLAKK